LRAEWHRTKYPGHARSDRTQEPPPDSHRLRESLPLSVVSKRLYGRSSFLDELHRGKQSITIDKLDEILRKLRRDWPEGADWPFLPAIFMDRRNGR
jgi:hypothetical protein